jgi:broad specificity phosphatase PhoE
LTEIGKQQADDRATHWSTEQVAFDTIICSPLQRAHTTALIIGERLDIPVETDDLWMERDNGALAGLPYSEARVRFPLPVFFSPFEKIAKDTGESAYELHARAALALQHVLQRPDGNYLIVAHGGILNAAVRTIVGTTPPINRKHGLFVQFKDLSYLTVRYHKNEHKWVLLAFHP